MWVHSTQIPHCSHYNWLRQRNKKLFHSSFSEMNLPNLVNLPNLAKMFTLCTKYFQRSSKCWQCRFKAFQNEINILNFNFDIIKRFLILTEFGQLSLSFGKTKIWDSSQMCIKHKYTRRIQRCKRYSWSILEPVWRHRRFLPTPEIVNCMHTRKQYWV